MEQNSLFPIFLVPGRLRFLIVGGGAAGSEKLRFLLKSSPQSQVKVVAERVSEEIDELSLFHPNVDVSVRSFRNSDLENIDVVIIATDDHEFNLELRAWAKSRKLLVNVADTPEFCDFYLGSIVTKGDLKIAISTNGKSPTFAKRFRQFLEAELPDELPELINGLHAFRNRLRGSFSNKVTKLNELTASLVENKDQLV